MAHTIAPNLAWLRPLAKGLAVLWAEALLPILMFGALMAVWLISGAPIAQVVIEVYAAASQQDQLILLNHLGMTAIILWLLCYVLRRTMRSRVAVHGGLPTAGIGRIVAADSMAREVPEKLRAAWRAVQGQHGARYAEWVIARVGLDATPAEVREYAADHHEQWVQATSTDLALERRARHEAAHAVVAHVLGCTVTKADVLVDGGVGGSVHWELPIPVLPDHEAAWVSMRATLAGRTIDHSFGEHDRGASSDIQHALRHAAVLVSAGLRPAGYAGGLTTDELLAAASDDAHRILTAYADVVDEITAALVDHSVLGSHDLRAIWHRAHSVIAATPDARAEAIGAVAGGGH